MAQTYVQRVNDEISRFFDDHFPRKFYRYESTEQYDFLNNTTPINQKQRFAYYRNFSVVGVSIVIFLPLFKNKQNEQDILSRRIISVVVKKIGKKGPPYLIELTDTMIKGSWRDRLHERVNILLELMETQIHKCDKCHVYMIPKTCRSRKDNKRTQFVSTQCPKCYKYKPTEFGLGLKTILHRNLKKKRSR